MVKVGRPIPKFPAFFLGLRSSDPKGPAWVYIVASNSWLQNDIPFGPALCWNRTVSLSSLLYRSFEVFAFWLIQIHLDSRGSTWLFWNKLQRGCRLLYDTVLYDAIWCCICISLISSSIWTHWGGEFWPPCPQCHALNVMLEGTAAKTTKQVSHGLRE